MDQKYGDQAGSRSKPNLNQMAKLVDLEPSHGTEPKLSGEQLAALSDFEISEIGNEDTYSSLPSIQEDPYQSRTKQPLWSNPFAKAGLVGTGTMIAVIATSSLLGDITKETVAQPIPEKQEAVSSANIPTPEEDKGKLLAELALGKQQQTMSLMNKANQSMFAKTSPGIARPVIRPIAFTRPIIRQVYSVPTYTRSAPIQTAISQNMDPQQQWQALSQVGSFGQTSSGASGIDNSGGNRNFSNPNPQLVSQVTNSPEEEPPLLTGRLRRSVITGTMAQGLLATPVIWEGAKRGGYQGDADNASGSSPDDEDRFIIQLTSSLKASDGSEALPVGTPLVVKVRSVSASGTLKLSAVAVIMEGEEISLPPGTISIRASGGGPLTARNMQDRGAEIASSDAGVFALAGISKAASLFTRAQSTTTTSGFSSTTSTQNPPPDILAGILEGGTNAIVSQIQARNERAIQESLARPDIWMLAAGTSVQVFVNKSVPNL
jgi:Bacterial conjugation TrbI-like protein